MVGRVLNALHIKTHLNITTILMVSISPIFTGEKVMLYIYIHIHTYIHTHTHT